MPKPAIRKAVTRSNRLGLANWRALLVFLIIAASLLGSIILIYETVEAERQERQQMQRTSEILLELRNISRAAINAEGGQRGYLISLNRQHLTPYTLGQETYRSSLDRLDSLLGPDRTPRQAELYDLIEANAEQKFAALEKSVELINAGRIRDAQRDILLSSEQETMQSLRHNIRQMENMENRLLADATAQTAITEGRVLPLLGGLFFFILVALLFGFEQASRAARAEAEAANADALREARDRADLLARELNHRVKNIFAVILAIVRMTGRNAPESKDVIDNISERIRALLTAHDVTQGTPGKPAAELQTLIETSFAPYSSKDRSFSLEGPPVRLPTKQVTPLGLVLHELTTNAVKYGAWADGGRVEVKWKMSDGDLAIEWREFCAKKCAPGTREGFGTMLMVSAARQLQGSIERRFEDSGACIDIRFRVSD